MEDRVEFGRAYSFYREQLTGLDLYGARSALLHEYSVFSRLSREGKCRVIGYADRLAQPVVSQPKGPGVH